MHVFQEGFSPLLRITFHLYKYFRLYKAPGGMP
jgi:hypothetical protein